MCPARRTVKGITVQHGAATAIDYMDLPEPPRISDIPKKEGSMLHVMPTSLSHLNALLDEVMPARTLMRKTKDVKAIISAKSPKTATLAHDLEFNARVHGILRAMGEGGFRTPKRSLMNLFSVIGPNLSYGCPREPKRDREEIERAYYTFARGFMERRNASSFVREFMNLPNSLDIATVILRTINTAATQGVAIRPRNVSECIGLMASDKDVRQAYGDEDKYLDEGGYLTGKGLFVASVLRRPERLKKFAAQSFEETMRDSGHDAERYLEQFPGESLFFRVRQGTRVVNLRPGSSGFPKEWDHYVSGDIRKSGIHLIARDLGWCQPEESCRGAIRSLLENGFKGSTPTTVYIVEGQKCKPTFTHKLEEWARDRNLTKTLFKQAHTVEWKKKHPFKL